VKVNPSYNDKSGNSRKIIGIKIVMVDPRQSLAIIVNADQLHDRLHQLARFLGWQEYSEWEDLCTQTFNLRFTAVVDGTRYTQQVAIPTHVFLKYHPRMPFEHIIWLEVCAKLKGYKDAE
jgi:hypothetical protein